MNTVLVPPVGADVPADGESLYEVVNGQRVEMPPMSFYTTLLASRLHLMLGGFVAQHALGTTVTEALFILDPADDLRRRPDLAYISADRWPMNRPWPEAGDPDLAPDLAVEVISPSELFERVLAKVAEYFAHGVKQVWLVVPAVRQVYVYDSGARVRIFLYDAELADTIVPGFTLRLADLFQKPAA